MIKAKDFKIFSYQSSIFTPGSVFVSSKILSFLLNNFSDQFDGETTSLPLSADAPADIPRIILRSIDNKLSLEVAPIRINIFRKRIEQDHEQEIDLNSFFNLCNKIFENYLDKMNPKVGRLATVTIKYKEDENPAYTLSRFFCKEGLIKEPLKRPEKFEIHAHKKYCFEDFHVNSWIRFKTGILKHKDIPIILIEQDINTLAEEIDSKNFNITEITKFQTQSNQEQNEILIKYFPNG